jgi:hypothetical protein
VRAAGLAVCWLDWLRSWWGAVCLVGCLYVRLLHLSNCWLGPLPAWQLVDWLAVCPALTTAADYGVTVAHLLQAPGVSQASCLVPWGQIWQRGSAAAAAAVCEGAAGVVLQGEMHRRQLFV